MIQEMVADAFSFGKFNAGMTEALTKSFEPVIIA